MQTDMATTVAERCIDYYYDKIEQENKRKYEEIQKRKELRRHKYKTAANIAVLLVMIGLCMSMVFLEMRVRSPCGRSPVRVKPYREREHRHEKAHDGRGRLRVDRTGSEKTRHDISDAGQGHLL